MMYDTCFTRTWVDATLARWREKTAPFFLYTHILGTAGMHIPSWNWANCLSKFTLSCHFVFFSRLSSNTHTQISQLTSKIWEKMLATQALISIRLPSGHTLKIMWNPKCGGSISEPYLYHDMLKKQLLLVYPSTQEDVRICTRNHWLCIAIIEIRDLRSKRHQVF